MHQLASLFDQIIEVLSVEARDKYHYARGQSAGMERSQRRLHDGR